MTDTPKRPDFSNVSFNADDIKDANAARVLRKGHYQGLIIGVEPQVSKSGWAMLRTRVAPLRQENKEASKSTRDAMDYYMMLPFFVGSEDKAKETPEADRKALKADYAQKFLRNLRALKGSDQFPRPPTYDAKAKAFVFPDGRKVDQNGRDAARDEVMGQAYKTAEKLLKESPEALEGHAAYFYATHETYNGHVSAKVGREGFKETLPKNAELVPPAKWYTVAQATETK